MSTNKTGPGSAQDWQAMQQQWWASVLEGAKPFATPASFNPAESFKGFGDLFGNKLGSEQPAAVERFLAGSKQFLQWVEGLSAQVAARGGIPGKIEDWTTLFKQSAGNMHEGHNPFTQLFQGLAGDGARNLEQMFANMPNPADALKGELKNLLGMPAFGFQREQQERAQQLIAAQIEQQDAMTAYNAQMLRASKLSFERLELKLAEREEPGRQLESLRAVYDLWIDAAEEAYAEVALSAEFRSAYGNLVNKQMRVRQMMQAEVERHTGQVGMPTRSELNSVHQRVQEMRRRIRDLEDRLEEINSAPAAGSTSASPKKSAATAKTAKPAARKVTPTTTTAKASPKAAAKPAAKPVTKPAPKSVGKRVANATSTTRKSAATRRSLNRLA